MACARGGMPVEPIGLVRNGVTDGGSGVCCLVFRLQRVPATDLVILATSRPDRCLVPQGTAPDRRNQTNDAVTVSSSVPKEKRRGMGPRRFERRRPMDSTHRLLRLQIVVIWRIRVKLIYLK